MQEFKDFEDEQISDEEPKTHYFCKLTFGQFFTLIVLEIITLCFVFYLGARYGNEYLKLDVLAEAKREPISIVSDQPKQVVKTEEEELKEMAKKALEGGSTNLKQRVEEILARQHGPTPPPVGEPSLTDSSQPSTENEDTQLSGMPLQQEQPVNAQANQEQPGNTQLPINQNEQPNNLAPANQIDPTQEVVKVKSTGTAKFAIQVGSYPDVKEASYRVEEWKAKGYPAYMMIANLGDKGQWYRVRVGAFGDKDEAGKYLGELVKREGIEDAFVVINEQ